MPALDFGGFSIGIREGVIGLIAAVALYMLVVVLRMRRLSKRREPVSMPANTPAAEPPAVAAEEPPVEIPEPSFEPPASRLADEVLRQGLEQELAQLRDEVDAIRGELAALREDMYHELGHLRAAQTVSPLYGDAMQMAIAGYDPAAIAERCGIARAEAELVVALAKSQNPER